MSLRLSLLGLINDHPMTGYDLKKLADVTFGKFREAQTSQVYRELNFMEDLGWLSSQIKIQTDKPNKRIYSITSAGKKAFLDWLAEGPLEGDKLNVSAFVIKTFLAGNHTRERNVEMFEEFKQACLNKLASLEGSDRVFSEIHDRLPGYQRHADYWGFTNVFEKDYYQMCIAWADKCLKAMRSQVAS